MRRLPLLAVSLLSLPGGCAAPEQGRYPSLLPRAVERRSDEEPVQPAAAVPAADPALDATLATRRAELQRHRDAFDVQQGRAAAAAAAARGQPAGSEPWIAAQTALAGLDSERADVSALVADLEQLAIERGAGGDPAYPPLDTLQAAASAELTREAQRIGQLQGLLAR